jgi:hypothetical protein
MQDYFFDAIIFTNFILLVFKCCTYEIMNPLEAGTFLQTPPIHITPSG